MKNIEMILKIRDLIRECNFIADDISVILDIENVSLEDMISKNDEDILEFLRVADKINTFVNLLTEDLKSSMANEGFNVEDFEDWLHQVEYDGMRFVGLFESLQNSMQCLEIYVLETIRGFRILTQNVYGIPNEEEE